MATASLLAPNPLAGDEIDEGLADAATKEVFSTYTCRSLAGIPVLPHPGDIAEPASLAAIPLPPSTYPLVFPDSFYAAGKLSALQLEGVLHACTKHLTWLPSGERAGFFIGDGAGVGKGRQISGIILDAWCRKPKAKAVWVSTSSDLYTDACRDMRDLGATGIPVIRNLQALDNCTNTPQEGVLFATYSTLISKSRGKSRLAQLVDWLGGASFDGVLVFDEAHKAKHGGASDSQQGTQVAAAVLSLQQQLPAARVVYCSATGISEVGNMGYLSRLGLYGPGSPFPTFQDMLGTLRRKGISFMELLAMELKGDGFFVARGLSFRSAEFSEVEVALTPQQAACYDAAARCWASLRAALTEAVAATGAEAAVWRPFWSAQQRFFKLLCVSMKVPSVVQEAKAALEQGQCVVIGLQSTGEAAADALNIHPGDACGFVSVTKEIMIQFINNHFPTTRPALPAAVHQPQQMSAFSMVNNAGAQPWDASNPIGVLPPPLAPLPDEIVPEAMTLKEEALRRAEQLELPPNFLDELIDSLGGKHAVAEMTGRKARIVRDAKGRGVYELRAKPDSNEMESLNIKEKDAFMAGKKLVAIVSDAASTGISLHADRRAGNQRRRVHLTIELPWSADKAIQQLGRSHRSNQVSAPLYKLVFTDLGGERRFAAAVARRLQSLGALTKGDRRASGLDLSALNYDSPLGRRALKRFYDALVDGSPVLPPGVHLTQVLEGASEEDVAEFMPSAGIDGRVTAAALVDSILRLHSTLRNYVDMMGISVGGMRSDTVVEDHTGGVGAAVAAAAGGGGSNKDTGDVKRFLNRLLAVPVKRQRLLFNYFQLSLEAEVRAAKAAGSYSEGVSDLPGQKITRKGPAQVLWTDPTTQQITKRHDLSVDRGVPFSTASARLDEESRPGDGSGFYVSRRPLPGSVLGKHGYVLALRTPGTSGTYTIVRPNTGPSFLDMEASELHQKYARCPTEKAREPWEESFEASLEHCTHGPSCQAGRACHVGRRITTVTLLSGSVVRIWDSLERTLMKHEAELSKADRALRIVRVESAGELPLIGVRFPGHLLGEVVAELSALEQIGAGTGRGVGGGGALRVEEPMPVDPKALKKAFSAPKTLLSFFQPKAVSEQKKRPFPDTDEQLNSKKKDPAPMLVDLVSDEEGEGEREDFKGQGAGGDRGGDGACETKNDVDALCAMGFTEAQATKALRVAGGCVERAANWLFAK